MADGVFRRPLWKVRRNAMAKILVVNGHCLGEYCDVIDIPLKGETVTARNRRYTDDGGKGSNAAVAVGRLGGSVAFIGKAGNDEGGVLGQKWMSEAGVDLSHYFLDDSIQTNVGLCVIAADGSNIIFNFFDDRNSISPEELKLHLSQYIDAEYMITGFELPWRTSLYAARLAHSMGIKSVLNASPLDSSIELDDLSFVDILVVNELEAAFLLKEESADDPSVQAKKLSEIYGSPCVIITLGDKGSIAYKDGEIYRAKPYATVCVDTVGAGDGYLAALIWRMSEGDDLGTAMQWASGYAAYVCSHMGTINVFPTLRQLDEFLSHS